MKNSLVKLQLVIACAGVIGSAPDTEQPRSAVSVWPAVVTNAQAAHVAHPGRELPAGAGTLQSPSGVGRQMERAGNRLGVAYNWGDGFARATQKTGATARDVIPAAVAVVPESPGWLQLVCGLVFVVFMAQRRSRPPAD